MGLLVRHAPARGGRISKQGSPRARWALVEAARSVAQQPGPLHAFYERLRARRGHNSAIVAVARKLAVLFYCMLTREEDYAHQQPSLTAQKLRRLEVRAGAPTLKGTNTGRVGHSRADAPGREAPRPAGRGLLQALGRRLAGHVAQEQGEGGRERDSGARIIRPLKGGQRHAAGHGQAPGRLLFDTSSGSRPQHNLTPPADVENPDEQRPTPKIRSRPRHRAHMSAIQRQTTTHSATYLARNRTQIPSNTRQATVDFHRSSEASASPGCQWPSVSPQVRPCFLPSRGHVFSPLVAIFSPHHVGCRALLVQGLHPLAGGRLGEPVAVLPFCDDYVCVM
jgi:hypothetical protein